MMGKEFDYYLPKELIAQTPIEPRDSSRLMVVHRPSGKIEHRFFRDIVDYLPQNAILIFNNTKVVPAKLIGRKKLTGGRVEILLVRREEDSWQALVKPARVKDGTEIEFSPQLSALVLSRTEEGIRKLKFLGEESELFKLGEVPLPPYIKAPLEDPNRYQTIYASIRGSIAAPTAGLHFTEGLLERIKAKGIEIAFVTLHIGLSSIRPLKEEKPTIPPEYGEVSPEASKLIRRAKESGQPAICVGTSTVKIAEELAIRGFVPFKDWVGLLISPGFKFQATSALITNFHLPRSTHLMLVCAFARRGLIMKAYQEAINLRYRFYSFGDAMLIL